MLTSAKQEHELECQTANDEDGGRSVDPSIKRKLMVDALVSVQVGSPEIRLTPIINFHIDSSSEVTARPTLT